MEPLFEQQRRYHEERERIVDAMVKETLFVKKTVNSVHYLTSNVDLCKIRNRF